MISNSCLQNRKIIETVSTDIKNKYLIYFWVISSSTNISMFLNIKHVRYFFHDCSFQKRSSRETLCKQNWWKET